MIHSGRNVEIQDIQSSKQEGCQNAYVMGKDRIHLMQKVTDYFEDYLK